MVAHVILVSAQVLLVLTIDSFFMFSYIDYPPVERHEEIHDDPNIIREECNIFER